MRHVTDPTTRRPGLFGTRSQTVALAVMVAVLIAAPFISYPPFLMECMCFALFALAFNL